MINYNNHNITGISYNNHSIKYVYGCGGNLVWSGDTPTAEKFTAIFSDSTSYSAECDGNSTLTTGDTRAIGYPRISGMTDITIGNCVTSIGTSALGNIANFQLSSVTMPNVTTISESAFYADHNLSRINSDTEGLFDLSNVLLFGIDSLRGTKVKNVILNNNATLGESTFHSCGYLEEITIPSSATEIPPALLVDCTNLSSVTIPNGVTAIRRSAFNGCSNLSGLTIPTGVTTIELGAFGDCTSLSRLNSNLDGLFNIPSGVTTITSSVFAGCTSLINVSIPSGVTSIGTSAFASCTSLTGITIPTGVTIINTSTFADCTSLSSIIIPNSITRIYSNAFSGCTSLTSVTIPSSVTEMQNYVFNYCTSLTSVTVESTTPPTLSVGSRTFDMTNNCPIYVPYDSVDTYKAADGWSDYADRIQPIP